MTPRDPPARSHAIRDVIRTKALTFSFAARFLDPPRRRATEVLYAFFRMLDDLVDERQRVCDEHAIGQQLAAWELWLDDVPSAPVETELQSALREVMLRYHLPPSYLRSLILGLRDDLRGTPIDTFEDLERYSFRVAGTVGLAMAHVLGATSRTAMYSATALGIAMQLTNVLRDVGDDVARGRIYLPADELAEAGAGAALESRQVNDALRAVLRNHISRARAYYQRGVQGIAELPSGHRFSIALAAWLYELILSDVERHGYDVFGRRAHVGPTRKVLVAVQLALLMRMDARWPARGTPWPPMDTPESLSRAATEELVRCGAPGFTVGVAAGG